MDDRWHTKQLLKVKQNHSTQTSQEKCAHTNSLRCFKNVKIWCLKILYDSLGWNSAVPHCTFTGNTAWSTQRDLEKHIQSYPTSKLLFVLRRAVNALKSSGLDKPYMWSLANRISSVLMVCWKDWKPKHTQISITLDCLFQRPTPGDQREEDCTPNVSLT